MSGEEDSNLRREIPPDLQSGAIGRSAISGLSLLIIVRAQREFQALLYQVLEKLFQESLSASQS